MQLRPRNDPAIAAVVLFVLAGLSDTNWPDFRALGLAWLRRLLPRRALGWGERTFGSSSGGRPDDGRVSSVPEVPAPGEDHRGAGALHRRDHVRVALRAAWLDQRGHTRIESKPRPVREGEERIRGEYRAVE